MRRADRDAPAVSSRQAPQDGACAGLAGVLARPQGWNALAGPPGARNGLALLATSLLLAACPVTTTQVPFCSAARPILTEPADTPLISQSLVDQLHAHNLTGDRLCSWFGGRLKEGAPASP